MDVVPAGLSTCIEAFRGSSGSSNLRTRRAVMVFVGIDWSEMFHDVAILDEEGRRLKSFRIPHGVEGLATLQRLLAELTIEPTDVVVAVESTHGLLVNTLVGSGYAVYPINPRVAARYRERDSVAGVKSDRRDADVLANLVRTDRERHRPLAGDSEAAQEIRARARAHLRAIRTLIRLRNQLRSLLLEFYPAAAPLLAAEDLGDALAVLAVAPDPEQGQRVSLRQLEAALRRQGRQRNLVRRSAEIQELLRAPHLHLSRPALVAAYRDEVASLVRMLRQARGEVRDLEAQLSKAFRGHPDAEIYRSFPGLADVLGGRVLGEAGDDPTRYPNATARCRYAGNVPVTRASGKYREVHRRVVRNRWLADATYLWAYSAIRHSPGARHRYDQLRRRGQLHNQALRVVANRLVACLHACLRDHRPFDEARAWPALIQVAAA